MYQVHLGIAGLIFLISAVVWFRLAVGMRKLRWLRDVSPEAVLAWPRVSIVIPARNEEREIQTALRSVLALDYPDYEVLVVNDRSTDQTGEILARMQHEHPQLKVATVAELPPGWLGKNHALEFGAAQSTGDLILFTDADIVMRPDALRRAVVYLEREPVDHLTIGPDVEMPDWFLEAFVVAFRMLFMIFTEPWKLRDPRSPAHVGIGAFNLLRASVYRDIGMHRPIAMRPDDDFKLGKLVKKSGYSQDFLIGHGFLRVRWYASLRELIDGLMKNAFSAVDYHVSYTAYSATLMIIVNVWPFLAIWLTAGPLRWLYVATVCMHCASFTANAWAGGARWWGVFAYPAVFGLFSYIQWRAMLLTYYNNGIYWRNTHYSLAELRANKV